MVKNLIIGGISLLFLMWVLSACQSDGKRKASRGDKPKVAVSIPPQLFFLKNIAGDKVDYVCLLRNSADPESFEPTPGQRMELSGSDVYLPLGSLPFEMGLIKALQNEKNGPEIVEAGHGVEGLSGTHGHSHADHSDGHSHGDDHQEIDPHIWSSAKNAKVIALNTLNALIAVDSANEDYYRANYGRLEARLDSIDRSFEKIFSEMPQRPSFIVWHPSLSYFAHDYGLTQVALSDAGKEASVKAVVDKLRRADGSKAPVWFYQKEFDSGKAGLFASESGVKMVEINPMNEEWEDEMQKLYDAFTLD